MTLYFKYRNCDRTRFRREYRRFYEEVLHARPDLLAIRKVVHAKAGNALDLLVMAGAADEHGFEYLARFLRRSMTISLRSTQRYQERRKRN